MRSFAQFAPTSGSSERPESGPAPRPRAASARAALQTASRAAALVDAVRAPSPPARGLADEFRQAADADARERLEHRVRAHLPRCTLSVTLTDNRYTMISVRREPRQRRYRLRLHNMFADASPTITHALALYVAHNDTAASRLLGDFIDEHQHRVRSRRARHAIKCITQGDVHDLRAIFDDLNARYFGGAIDARITWGPRSHQRRHRNRIKMGSYSVEEQFIRIHRTLDRPFVPEYFVAWIVYHEMLHQVHQAPLVGGRRQFHTPAFLQDEARYERFDQARLWERAHIDALLGY